MQQSSVSTSLETELVQVASGSILYYHCDLSFLQQETFL
jgi:hypothetical protein